VGGAERRATGLVASAFPAFDQAVAIEHRMHGANRRGLDHRVLTGQLVTDLGRAPGGVFALDAENGALDLVGQAVGLPVGRPAAIVERIQAAFFVAIEDLVAGDSGDAELTAQGRHFLAFQEAGYEAEAFVHWFTLIPGHLGAPQMRECVNHVLGIICKLCVDKLTASYVSAAPQARDAGDHLVTIAPRIPSYALRGPLTADVKPHVKRRHGRFSTLTDWGRQ